MRDLTNAILQDRLPPENLEDLVGKISPRPVFFIHAGADDAGHRNPELTRPPRSPSRSGRPRAATPTGSSASRRSTSGGSSASLTARSRDADRADCGHGCADRPEDVRRLLARGVRLVQRPRGRELACVLHRPARSRRRRGTRIAGVPDRLHFTESDEANALIASDPMALLVGFVLDQQITVQQAFTGPLLIRERLGSLDADALAEADLEPLFRQRPAIHRYPAAMARRVHELAVHVRDRYDGEAARVWTDAGDAAALRANLVGLPGFGEMKVKALGSVLAKRFGVEAAQEPGPVAPDARGRRLRPGARRLPGGQEGPQGGVVAARRERLTPRRRRPAARPCARGAGPRPSRCPARSGSRSSAGSSAAGRRRRAGRRPGSSGSPWPGC